MDYKRKYLKYKYKYFKLKKLEQLGGKKLNIFDFVDIKIKKIINNTLKGGSKRRSLVNKNTKKPNQMESYYKIELKLHKKKYPEYTEIVNIMIRSDYEGKNVSNYVHSKKEYKLMVKKNKYIFTLEDINQDKISFSIIFGSGNKWINKKWINNLTGDIRFEEVFTINELLKKKKQVGGGAETYCYLCGCPIFNYGYKIKNLKKYKKYFDTLIKKYPDYGCLISLIEYKFPEKIKKEIKNDLDNISKIKKYNWLNNISLLHWSGMLIKIKRFDDDGWMGNFIDEFGNNHYTSGRNFIVHDDCYKITKSKYGNYTSLNMITDNISYGIVEKNMTQNYDFLKYFYDNIDYVLDSPLKNTKNKKRILNINHKINKKINPKLIDFLTVYNKNNKIPNKGYNWVKEMIESSTGDFNNYMQYFEKIINRTVSKKKKNRPSPSESATKFEVGTKKKGNDGNMWIIVENKNGVKRWSKKK